MVIRWKAREIIFPARGKGPWTLAYDNTAPGPLDAELRLPAGADEELELAVFTGEKRYEKTALATPEENNLRVYILWAFLCASVITLSVLAFHIAKSMKKW